MNDKATRRFALYCQKCDDIMDANVVCSGCKLRYCFSLCRNFSDILPVYFTITVQSADQHFHPLKTYQVH